MSPLLPSSLGAGSNGAITADLLHRHLFYLFSTVISRKFKINTLLFSAKIKGCHPAIIDRAVTPDLPTGPLPGIPD